LLLQLVNMKVLIDDDAAASVASVPSLLHNLEH
jgi:hypothetical protein